MKKIVVAMFLFIGLALAGCQPPSTVVSNYTSLSTHTLQVASDKQADVVWVQTIRGGEFVLMRCYNAPEGPACTKAKTP